MCTTGEEMPQFRKNFIYFVPKKRNQSKKSSLKKVQKNMTPKIQKPHLINFSTLIYIKKEQLFIICFIFVCFFYSQIFFIHILRTLSMLTTVVQIIHVV